MSVVLNVLSKLSLEAFGISMPRIAWHLAPANVNCTYTENPAGQPPLTLSGTQGGNNPAPWIALLAGAARKVSSSDDIGFPLTCADGTLENQQGLLITVFPQLRARLSRLYHTLLENAPNPSRGAAVRPVPCHFFYAQPDAAFANAKYENVNPGDPLGNFQFLRVYDADGLPLDPVALLYAFSVLTAYHPVLQWLPDNTLGPVQMPGIRVVADSLAGATNLANLPAPVVRIRLCDTEGNPHNGSGLAGITAVDAANGIFTLNPVNNNALAGMINVTPGGNAALAGVRIGSPSNSTFGNAFAPPPLTNAAQTPPAPPPGLPGAQNLPVIYRDFFTVRVVDLDKFLLGAPDPQHAAPSGGNATLEPPPVVRINEALTLFDNGNDVLAAAQAALNGANNQSQCVAQSIRADFLPPAATGAMAQWPAFPPGINPVAQPLPYNLLNAFTYTAQVVNPPLNNNYPFTDVILTISNLPSNTAVRVYPRKFIADARELRGDGAGVVLLPGQTAATLYLKDPFSLIQIDGTSSQIGATAVLHFDLVLVSASAAQMFGNIRVPVQGMAAAPPIPGPAVNNFTPAVFCGTCQSEVLGLTPPPVGGFLPFFNNLLGNEAGANPREAPRAPLMAHRDLLVAGSTGAAGAAWSGVIAGGRLESESLSAAPRAGCPSSAGGRETQMVGVGTTGGVLAYDLARMALRRSRFLPPRMIDLTNAMWDAPATPAAANGTFAGAVLQNTPPLSQTPSFYYLRNDMSNYSNPATLDALINWLVTNLNGKTINEPIGNNPVKVDQFMPGFLNTSLGQVNTSVGGAAAPQPARKDRVFKEVQRDLIASIYGRRDTEWALRAAIARARRFIYIESPGLCSTSAATDGSVQTDDLLTLIKQRMAQVPGLVLLVCVPRETDFPEKFQPMANYEMFDRADRLSQLPAPRTLAFHPIGFPGRPSRLESQAVIVDDLWALVGSSSFRQRGLRFDGSSDLVFTDMVVENGICPTLSDFRRRLQAQRLGLPLLTNGMPHPDYVRLSDGREAFTVVQEMLEAGGLGVIESLWKPEDSQAPQAPAKYANPDADAVVQDISLLYELFVASKL